MPEITEGSLTISELKTVYDYSVQNINKKKEIEKLSGISCDLDTDGFLYTIFQKDNIEPMEKFVAEYGKHGFPIEFWNKEKLEYKLGSTRYEGAIFVKDGGSVHAMKLIHALKILCENNNVEIYENSPVAEIIEGEKIKLLVGENHQYVVANHIVLATNAFTSKLGYFKGKVMPLHIVTAATKPLTNKQLKEINWRSRLPFADSRLELYHLVLTPNNRIIIGGGYSNYFFNNDLDFKDRKDSIANAMMIELEKMYPQLKGIQFENIWNGIMGVTMDMEEIFGITGKNENILYALGYNGHGVNSSIMHGKVIADMYKGINTDYLNIRNGNSFPLPPEPFRFIGVRSFLLYSKWHDKQK
jgi:glycine/D-amino acid oxidase-like deaminating enzyme